MGTAVLGHRAWRTDFGADPEVVGRTVKLDGYTYTIVGVLPAGLEIPTGRSAREIDIWKVPDRWWQNGDVWNMDGSGAGLLRLVGRLRPDVDIAAAEADLERVASGLRAEVAEYRTTGFALSAEPLREYVASRSRPVLVLLMATVVLLLLIVCANVTGLMLVRAESRQQDVAIRLAMGSSTGRVVRHLMCESLLLAAAGGGLGILLGAAGAVLLPRLAPPDLPRLGEVSIDARVLTFVLAISAGCTLLFGLAPAVQAARRGARAGLMRARTTADRTTRGMRHVLVIGQIAASLALLVCAGLFVATLGRLQQVSTGFDESNVLTFAVSVPGKRYGWPVETDRFYQRLSERIEALPGVESSAVIWPVPLSGKRWDGPFRGGDLEKDNNVTVRYELANAGFFETLRIPLLQGITFGAADPKRGVIVSQSLAERAWPGRSPIGQRLRASPWGRDTVQFEVIGVAGDVRYESLRREPTEVIYFDSRGYVWTDWEVNFVVRAASDFALLAATIRRELAALDAEIPVADVKPLSAYVEAELASIRFARTLFVLFAGIAAFLAAIGLYGVVAYSVRRRQREFGIRMTLGSGAGDVVRMVVREGVLLTLAGAAFGVMLAVWGTDLLSSLLFGVSQGDPLVYGVAAAGLLLVGVLASLVPAVRATRVDPASVLRAD
jgi:predicted permease